MSYVTGSHNFKVGTQLQRGHFERNDSNHAQGDYYIISLNGSQLLATITSPLAGWVDRLNYKTSGSTRTGLVDHETAVPLSGACGSISRTSRLTPTTTGQARGSEDPECQRSGDQSAPTGRT